MVPLFVTSTLHKEASTGCFHQNTLMAIVFVYYIEMDKCTGIFLENKFRGANRVF